MHSAYEIEHKDGLWRLYLITYDNITEDCYDEIQRIQIVACNRIAPLYKTRKSLMQYNYNINQEEQSNAE